MTVKQFKKLKPGTIVRWREGKNSPRAGELTDRGIVCTNGTNKDQDYIAWQDGQTTDGRDNAALQQVEIAQ